MNRTAAANQTCRMATAGLSLVESLIALATTSVALGLAIPGFDAAKERRHLEGNVAQMVTDLHLARSEAVAQNRTLRLSFLSQAAGSCYVIHTGAANSCACSPTGNAPVCSANAAALRSTGFATQAPVQLRSNVGSIVFDPTKGTITPTGTMRFTSAQGKEVRVVVNIMGRVRTCTPGGQVLGYRNC